MSKLDNAVITVAIIALVMATVAYWYDISILRDIAFWMALVVLGFLSGSWIFKTIVAEREREREDGNSPE